MAEGEGLPQIAADGTRRVQAPLLLLAASGLPLLPFLRHARNRLLSGQPVGLGTAIGLAGPTILAALAASCLLLLAPILRPRSAGATWLGLLGAGLVLAGASGLAGQAAAQLASGTAPSARTSLGAGFWLLTACLLLLASDGAQRLRRPRLQALAALLTFGPLVILAGSGALSALSLLREYAAQREAFGDAFARHLLLVAGALLPAVLVGVPLGVAAQRRPALRRAAFPVLNLVQTIPSIALFGLLIGPLSALGRIVPGIAGVGLVPALLALLLYSLLPIVRNTVEGLDGVPGPVRIAARAMGMTPAQAFMRVDAPLALPVLLSGLRVTAVQAIGLASVSALIGAGGFGSIMFQGLFANALDLVVLGALPVIALAVAADLALRALTLGVRRTLGFAA